MSDRGPLPNISLGLSREESFKLYDVQSLPQRGMRILILQAGHPDDPIACILERGTLGELAGTYEALSYAWGAEEASESILCNEVELSIRPNLAAAFRQLRRPHLGRRLWVDFLCINQADRGEKALQVALMYDVYAQSDRVLLWLGERAPGSDLVMDYVAQLDAEAEVMEHRRWQNRQSLLNSRPHALDYEPPARSHEGGTGNTNSQQPPSWPIAVGTFLSRPWFRRFWVQQEAAACPRTVVLCGNQYVEWNNLFAFAWRMMPGRGQFTPLAAQNSRLIPAEARVALRLIKLIHTNRQAHDGDRPRKASILYVLHQARGCEAADARDRIYAVQHLARQGGSTVQLAPDYDTPMKEICQRFAERYAVQRGLAILAFAGRAAQDPVRAEYLPSWVPDWENAKRHNFMGPSRQMAGGGQSAKGRLAHDETTGKQLLVAEALILGTLQFLSGTVPGGPQSAQDEEPRAEMWHSLATLEKETYDLLVGNRAHVRYRNGRETLASAYAQTVIANSIRDLRGKAPLVEQCKQWRTSLDLALSRGIQDPNVDREIVAFLDDLDLNSEPMTRSNSVPSSISLDGTEESRMEGDEGFEMYTQMALSRSPFAHNVQKTGTYVQMQVARTAKGGWLALVPHLAIGGDILCIVKGFSRGLVLREMLSPAATNAAPTEPPIRAVNSEYLAKPRRYEIIGPSYIHGAMQGEMAPKPPASNEAPTDLSGWVEVEFV